jgi:diguanylate cyclase (GGDEF)-like protein
MIVEVLEEINAATLDMDDLTRTVTEWAQVITGAEGGVIELVEGNEMVYRATSGSARSWLGGRLSIDESLSGLCVQYGIPLLCYDADFDSRVDPEACRRIGVRSMIVVPLIHLNVPIGVLKVMSGEAARFDDVDLVTLQTLAGVIASSLSEASGLSMQAHRGLHDPLTGLPNRVLLKDRLEQALKKASRHLTGVGVFFIHLEGFKEVNESCGHTAAEGLLRAAAHELVTTLRASDTLARFGGDEFVLVCEDADRAVEEAVRERIARAVSNVAASAPEYRKVTATVGVAWGEQAELGADELLSAADASMYRVKRRRDENAGQVHDG